MRTYSEVINGRKYNIPVNDDGTVMSDDLRRAAGVPHNRALIHKRSDGSNHLINSGQRIRIQPDEYFQDAFLHRRGK